MIHGTEHWSSPTHSWIQTAKHWHRQGKGVKDSQEITLWINWFCFFQKHTCARMAQPVLNGITTVVWETKMPTSLLGYSGWRSGKDLKKRVLSREDCCGCFVAELPGHVSLWLQAKVGFFQESCCFNVHLKNFWVSNTDTAWMCYRHLLCHSWIIL